MFNNGLNLNGLFLYLLSRLNEYNERLLSIESV